MEWSPFPFHVVHVCHCHSDTYQQKHITYAATILYDNDMMCISLYKQIIQCEKEYMGQITA